MANIYAHKSWKIDTAGVVTTDRVRIDRLEFKPNAASDDLLVVDNNSEDIWRVTNALTGGRAGIEQSPWNEAQDFEGFNVSSIGSSCALNVYLK